MLRAIRVLAVMAMLAGCSRAERIEAVQIGGGDYETAFETAVEVARAEGLPPVLRDPRGGVIETDTAHAPTLLEPWHGDGAFWSRRLENTLSNQRRRARFVFSPPRAAAGDPAPHAPDPADLLRPPAQVDLTAATGPLELRVQVFLERAHAFGQRRSTWSRRMSSTSVTPGRERAYWVPVSRDVAFEQRLLQRIRTALGRAGPRETAAPAATP